MKAVMVTLLAAVGDGRMYPTPGTRCHQRRVGWWNLSGTTEPAIEGANRLEAPVSSPSNRLMSGARSDSNRRFPPTPSRQPSHYSGPFERFERTEWRLYLPVTTRDNQVGIVKRPDNSWSDAWPLPRRYVLRSLGAASALGALATPTALAQDENGQNEDEYDFESAIADAYWFSRYNTERVVFSENGVLDERAENLVNDITDDLDLDDDPVEDVVSLVLAPDTEGRPLYATSSTSDPELVADSLRWREDTNTLVTPTSWAWSNLAYAQLSLAFEEIGDPISEDDDTEDFLASLYGQTVQRGLEFALVDDEALRDEEREDEEDDEDKLFLYQTYDTTDGSTVSGDPETDRPTDYAAVLWLCSMLLDQTDSYGFENPEEELEVEDLEEVTDMVARTIHDEFSPSEIGNKEGIRGVGVTLSALSWYGVTGTNDDVVDDAENYADALVGYLSVNTDEDGRAGREGEAINQAAAQAAAGQGLFWASEAYNIDTDDDAEAILEYLTEDLWNSGSGTFDDERDEPTLETTVRDTGDLIGGLNAALEVLDEDEIEEIFRDFVRESVRRSRLQRAELRFSREDIEDRLHLPFPDDLPGQFGQPPVFNAAVALDETNGWEITSNTFLTAGSMYAACQLLWMSEVDNDEFPGRGRPE